MSIKIQSKIVGFDVKKPGDVPTKEAVTEAPKTNVVQMHETLERPDELIGSTYKLKTPEHVSQHAMYITINDIVLNKGTEHEMRRPFEMFVNSKNMDHFQWIVALTRIVSAVFRKGGDVTFLVEELRSVFDPRGGYWNNGKYQPSLVSEIGDIIEKHLTSIGMLRKPELDERQKAYIDAKREEFSLTPPNEEEPATSGFPADAKPCAKCNTQAVIVMDGCMTCLNCGDSKCG
ncbi:MAG: NrdJb [Gammaproteobacteria bacterium]|nr:NrdJb [Gammaproteobacteria bacterium]